MNNKKFLIALLSVLILVFNSCNNDSTNPTNPKVSFKVSDLVGTWRSTSSTDTFTISREGAVELNFGGQKSSTIIGNWNGNEEIPDGGYYDMRCPVNLTAGGSGELYFRFSSPSDCIVTLFASSIAAPQQEKFRKQ